MSAFCLRRQRTFLAWRVPRVYAGRSGVLRQPASRRACCLLLDGQCAACWSDARQVEPCRNFCDRRGLGALCACQLVCLPLPDALSLFLLGERQRDEPLTDERWLALHWPTLHWPTLHRLDVRALFRSGALPLVLLWDVQCESVYARLRRCGDGCRADRHWGGLPRWVEQCSEPLLPGH
jgi:hypothetical protein